MLCYPSPSCAKLQANVELSVNQRKAPILQCDASRCYSVALFPAITLPSTPSVGRSLCNCPSAHHYIASSAACTPAMRYHESNRTN